MPGRRDIFFLPIVLCWILIPAFSPPVFTPVSYTHLDVYKRQTADGRTSRVYVTHATAAEALRLCQVELEAQDLLNFDLEQSLCEGDRVVVTRVDYRNTYYTEAVPYTVEYTPTSLLASGRKRVLTTGSNGSRVITLREKYLNDQLVSSREEAEYVTQAPVNATACLLYTSRCV